MAQVALDLQPCCGRRSGIGTYAYELARRLQSDEELSFYGNLFGNEALDPMPFPVRRFPRLPYGIYRRIWNYIPYTYHHFFPNADLNIFFDYIVPPRVTGKVITTVHDLAFVRYPETMNRRNLRRIRHDIVYSLERSDRILTVSQFSKEELISCMGVDRDRISVIYNAPSVSENLVDAKVLLERHQITPPYLLYVGTIEPRKNIVRLLLAFERLKKETGIPHQLVLAGGNGWKNKDTYNVAQSLSCQKDIRWTGYVSAAEKNTLYQQAQVFVFPSLYEGFGIPPLEAMHFGCPVVCAKAASLPEVVGDAGIFVDPMDEISIAQGIWTVLSKNTLASELRARGIRRAGLFTWEQSGKQLKDLCKVVLEVR